ncbi:MAG: MBL fold metallo-hydrolase [Opitutus sp.]|nr:MBL fold metallo-hydrolase [Opitutus sp.]
MSGGITHWQVDEQVHCIKSVYAANKPLWVHVIEGDFALWVDTGIDLTPAAVVMPDLAERAPPLWNRTQMAVITHADVDHFGGLRGLRNRRPDTLVLAHGADKAWIESPARILRERYLMHEADGIVVPPERRAVLQERGGGGGKVDIALAGGEEIDTGCGGIWRVLPAPGHSAGHLILWNAAQRWAMIGDAALDWGVPDDTGKLIAPPPYYDVAAYRGTLGSLGRLGAERMFTSHHGVLGPGQIEPFLRNSAEAVDTLEAAVGGALRERPDGWPLFELCRRTGQLAGRWAEPLWAALADPISAHLKHGIAAGAVRRTATDGQVRYAAAGRG